MSIITIVIVVSNTSGTGCNESHLGSADRETIRHVIFLVKYEWHWEQEVKQVCRREDWDSASVSVSLFLQFWIKQSVIDYTEKSEADLLSAVQLDRQLGDRMRRLINCIIINRPHLADTPCPTRNQEPRLILMSSVSAISQWEQSQSLEGGSGVCQHPTTSARAPRLPR